MEKNVVWYAVGGILIGAVLGYVVKGQNVPPSNPAPSPAPTPIVKDSPATGWDLHIDAEKHFPGKPEMVAHHRCKPVSGLTECQLYDSDAKDARLVGVEMVVDTKTYQSINSQEQKLWHYHKTEIPKVNAKLPDLSPEEAAEVAKSLEETYGKVYLLWDPSLSDVPTGQPSITILD